MVLILRFESVYYLCQIKGGTVIKEKPFVLCDETWSEKAAGFLSNGLVAGVLETIAITLSKQIEMEKIGRQSSKNR